MEKILDIIEGIAYEKDLPIDNVSEAVKESVIKVVKETLDPNINYDIEIDKKNKTLHLYQVISVCEDSNKQDDNKNFITLSEAKKHDSDIKVGDELRYELSLEDMSRSAVNSLFKELEYRIQRLIENQLFDKYKSQVGKIVNGNVVRIDNFGNTFVEIDEVHAILPKKNRIKGEEFRVGDVVRAVLRRINIDKQNGIHIELSRTTPKMLEELLKLEVPELKDGEIEIVNSARIPGERAKVSLKSNSAKIDSVGATVGVKGVRINAVSKELKNENIDCIEYSNQPELYIARALSPALVISVKLDENNETNDTKKAIVNISDKQKPKAIGRNGINIRLASMLTGYEIQLVEIPSSVDNNTNETTTNDEPKGGIDILSSLFKE
ncbi:MULTISPECIES: transcription termination factor NusA [Helicobacter]|uniref:Transcription termination/antitermination protein NusA n=1 Tax=Helicobacter ibis TaxID=2962633 RepID=A0ABT4VEN6_9HELI|nr:MULTISPECIES: transcription termination factor NusA [Helicobacter]MDA3967384.1 transcription termination factor NusA [Helicobacter sp. WB40]MDA3969172.1 transcription termination factor NusA [Helicobacter ibis]